MSYSKWITCFYKREDVFENNIIGYKCASCGNYNDRETDYCPWCGAKMAGVDRMWAQITTLYPPTVYSEENGNLDELFSEKSNVLSQDLLEFAFESRCKRFLCQEHDGEE